MAKFKLTHYQITSDKLSKLEKERKILFLTDLHNNCYGTDNEQLLKAMVAQKPDAILIGGDMPVGKAGHSMDVARKLIIKMVDICSVYYANGNHEQRMKAYPDVYGTDIVGYQEELTNCGVIFLENSCAKLKLDNCEMQIYGLDIPMKYYKKFKKLHFPLEEMKTCLQQTDSEHFQILLAHNPLYVDTYLKWGADLILCGHLHGGVARVPGIGGVITPQFHLFPKYSGEHTIEGDASVVVSKGLGTHTIPFRIMNPAELVVLHLNPKKN